MIKQVSVIGGGLGGLAFAQGMRLLAGYQVVVYERDTSPSHRSQGYQIGLNSDGLGALNVLGLPGFSELVHENPLYGFMMTDDQLEGLVRFPVQKVGTQPTKMSLVNRFRLRDILATGITIQWDKKFVKYVETAEGVVAHFEDGSTAASSLLVGADGVNSKVATTYCNCFEDFHTYNSYMVLSIYMLGPSPVPPRSCVAKDRHYVHCWFLPNFCGRTE